MFVKGKPKFWILLHKLRGDSAASLVESISRAQTDEVNFNRRYCDSGVKFHKTIRAGGLLIPRNSSTSLYPTIYAVPAHSTP